MKGGDDWLDASGRSHDRRELGRHRFESLSSTAVTTMNTVNEILRELGLEEPFIHVRFSPQRLVLQSESKIVSVEGPEVSVDQVYSDLKERLGIEPARAE